MLERRPRDGCLPCACDRYCGVGLDAVGGRRREVEVRMGESDGGVGGRQAPGIVTAFSSQRGGEISQVQEEEGSVFEEHDYVSEGLDSI